MIFYALKKNNNNKIITLDDMKYFIGIKISYKIITGCL